MKRFVCIGLTLLLICVFSGAAAAGPKDAGRLLAKAHDPVQTIDSLNMKTPDSKDYKGNRKEKDLNEISEVVRTNKDKNWKKKRYCKPLFEFWCHRLCEDVSPSKPGGSKKWGKQCSPGMMSKCERCDFVQ